LLRATTAASGTPARVQRGESLVQASGRNSRKAASTGTSPRAKVSDTSDWQLARLPSAPQYCRGTPTECVPCFGDAVSSITRAAAAHPPIGPPSPPACVTTARHCQAGLAMNFTMSVSCFLVCKCAAGRSLPRRPPSPTENGLWKRGFSLKSVAALSCFMWFSRHFPHLRNN
jgi:hypothetical protein